MRRAAGGRARTYDVCVNSRPVGRIRLATDPVVGPALGRIDTLEIDPPDRRRGRGTVAALAAEEVLRGWGCRRIELTVPADAEPGLLLAAALGYTERARRMRKDLTTSPDLPAGSVDRPLSDVEYAAWLVTAHEVSVAAGVRQGERCEEAEERATAQYRALLPDGPRTPGQHLRVLAHGGVDVGTVWAALSLPDGSGGYVYDVRVAPEHRRQGHGRTLMLIAERACLAADQHTLAVEASPDAPAAQALSESLGYQTVDYRLGKPLL